MGRKKHAPLSKGQCDVAPAHFYALSLAFADRRDDLEVLVKNQAGDWESGPPLPVDAYRVEFFLAYHRSWGFYINATQLAGGPTQLTVIPDDVLGSPDMWEDHFHTIWADLLRFVAGQPAAIPQSKAPGNPVLPETIKKYHHYAKTTTMSANAIKKKLKTDTSTYYKYCFNYTGEVEIDMNERYKLIKKNQWPSERVNE